MYTEEFTSKTKKQFIERKAEENYCRMYRHILNELTLEELRKISEEFNKCEKELKHKNYKYNKKYKWKIKYSALKQALKILDKEQLCLKNY